MQDLDEVLLHRPTDDTLALDDPGESVAATRPVATHGGDGLIINNRFGTGAVHSGGMGRPGSNRVWTMKQAKSGCSRSRDHGPVKAGSGRSLLRVPSMRSIQG